MRYRRLGSSDIFISRIVAGAYFRAPEKEAIRALHLAFDHGLNAVDTAPMYGWGESEKAVGKAIAAHRSRVVVMTKAGIRWADPHESPDSRPSSLISEVDGSLSRLGVERIDVLSIHRHDPEVPLAEVMETLAELHGQGKIRAIGLCNFPRVLVEQAIDYLGKIPLAAVQGEYSLVSRASAQELFGGRWAVLAHRVLAQGALGKAARAVPKDQRRWAAEFAFENRAKISKTIEQMLAPIAAKHRATIAQVAIAWVLAHPEITSAIVGASTERQALENVTALEVELSAAEVEELSAAFEQAQIDARAPHSLLSRAERLLRRVVG